MWNYLDVVSGTPKSSGTRDLSVSAQKEFSKRQSDRWRVRLLVEDTCEKYKRAGKEDYIFQIKEKVRKGENHFLLHSWADVKAYIISFSFDPILSNGDLHQFSSVTQSCPTLCDPMSRSTTGLPVHYQLPEFTQIHVHRVGDANSLVVLRVLLIAAASLVAENGL